MFWWPPERVREWLKEHGATQSGDGSWTSGGESSADDVIHDLVPAALADANLAPDDRINLGFGLLDLLEAYGVAMYLRWEFTGRDATHADELDLVWEFCRELLERESSASAVEYWLWVDWFEDPDTSVTGFEQVTRGSTQLTPETCPDDPVLRRVDRVLRNSGPVPWAAKAPTLELAVKVPSLREAARQALANSERDYYGQIDIAEAAKLQTILDGIAAN
jgi:hypothetical protein